MGAVFMSEPTKVLAEYLKGKEMSAGVIFETGRLAMALEVLTQIKILRSMPITDHAAEMEAAFVAFLVDQDIYDEAEKWYGRLDAWRAPKFNAEGVGTVVRKKAFGPSSLAAAPEGALPRSRSAHASLGEHRDPDGLATSSPEESASSEA